MAIDEAKFRAPVEPGCLLDLNVGFVQKRARVCKFWGKASVEGKVTCEVQFTAMVADPPTRLSARIRCVVELAPSRPPRPLRARRFPDIARPVGTGLTHEGPMP